MIYDISVLTMLALFLLSFVVLIRWILKKFFKINIPNLSRIRIVVVSLLSGLLIVGLGYQFRTSAQKRMDEQSESKAAIESSKKARAKSESKAAIESSKKVKTKKPKQQYKNIETIFNMHSIKYLSNRRIFAKGAGVVLRNFKVIDFGADKMKQYHVLIAPKNASHTYFLLVFGDDLYKGRITYDTRITVFGSLNGKSRINDSQINSGIAQRYAGKRVILVLIDKIQVKN
ncbi:hypothetical protein [Lactiplantibacillus plantarum]|uniref:hypothetical protein n=1 Tax=Lactiplantibacillus plantarum TaxID=1590 RepID=UPI000FECB3EE|nr:hypothetical protein [Lactiplantibacillus plantarum]QAR39423.1 hypothetical protein EQJ27_16240 [Lactiplantibacillus plantarum]RWZ05097.1 hypothetical protein EQG51_15545 [Lactiplantibacillus plantarum]RWZ05145.1 hypothetical protein EQG51_15890 [Lactiplantibacillus plantarum]